LFADLRYRGQAFELTVPWSDVSLDDAGVVEVRLRFHDLHAQRFSYANPDDPVELVTLRLTAIGRMARPRLSTDEPSFARKAPTGTRNVHVNGRWEDVATWRRDAIGASSDIVGPAIVEEDYTTIYVAPGWALTLGRDGHLVAVRKEILA
jgi:N-methylhydantoinase A